MRFTACAIVFAMLVVGLPAAAEPDSTTPIRGRIALTFDDAPRGDGWYFTGPERTEALIAALDETEVEGAMFFVLTGNIAHGPDRADRLHRYVEAGHTLANHSHTHPWLWQSDSTDYLADIDQASDILAGFDGTEYFYRFPYLDEGRTTEKRDAIRAALDERDLRQGYVTVDNYDWYMEALAAEAVEAGHAIDLSVLGEFYVATMIDSIEFYDDMAVSVLDRSPHHVLLLHENDLAALFIDDLVRALRDDGWQIIPAVEAYRDAIADRSPDTLFLGQGRVAAIAHENGAEPSSLVHESEDEAFLRSEFERLGLIPGSP